MIFGKDSCASTAFLRAALIANKIQTEALPSSLSFSFVSRQQLACSVAMGQGLSRRIRLGRVDHVVCPTDLLFSL
jgi:hypothetical protein